MFLGYENDFKKNEPTQEEKDRVEAERRLNNAALAAALSTPVGAAAQAAAGIPAMLGGTPSMSTAASSRVSLQSASQLQLRLEAEKRAKRLHVSNLPEDFSESKVKEFLNSAMEAAGLASTKSPVANCFYNSDKRYAFVEMATLDEAAKCLANLDGVKLGELELKITRPQDYTQHTGMVAGVGMLQMPLSMPGAPSMPAPGAPMGLGNPMAQQQMLMQSQQQQLLQMQMRHQHMQQAAAMQAANAAQMAQANSLGALGRPMVPGMAAKPSIPLEEALEISKKARVLKFGNLPEDGELQNGLAAFLNELYKALKLNTVGGDSCVSADVDAEAKTAVVEFRTVKEAAAAKSHLNGVEYGSSKLSVEAPEGFSDLTPEETAKCLGNGVLGIDGDAPPKGSTLALAVAAAASASAATAAAAAAVPTEAAATQVLVLSNIFSEADLADAAECKDILEDTKDKCAESGEVKAAMVVRPGEGGDDHAALVGQTLVRFGEASSALAAAKAVHGVKFDGRPVSARFDKVELFEQLWALDSISTKLG